MENGARYEGRFEGSVAGGEGVVSGRIGEILVSRGKLSEEQLRAGQEAKKTDPRRLGEILLSLGFISEEDLVDPAAILLLSEKALCKYTGRYP